MVDRNGKRYGQRARGLRAVLGTVADAANVYGEHAHPGQEAICWGSLYGKSQALALVAELIAERWLAVEQQGGGRGLATVYCLPRMMEELAAERVQSPDSNEKPSDLAAETVRSTDETARSHTPSPADSREHGLSTEENYEREAEPALFANTNGHAKGKATATKARATPIGEHFTLTPDMRSWASVETPTADIESETAKFADHARAKGSTYIDWVAAWRNWLRRSVEYATPRQSNAPNNGYRMSESGRMRE